MSDDILIQGLENLNRAIDGDVVAVELLPKEMWTKPSRKIVVEDEDATATDNTFDEGIYLLFFTF